MVLDPVDGKAAAASSRRPAAQNIPVVSYDRLIQVWLAGRLRLVRQRGASASCRASRWPTKLEADGNPTGPIIKINGAPTDNNAKLFKSGSDAALAAAGVKVLA